MEYREVALDSWQARRSSGQPLARSCHAMAGDLARARVVLFGGYASGFTARDTWMFDERRVASDQVVGTGCARMQVPMLLAAAPLLPRERLVLDLHSAMPLAPSVTGASGLASVTIAFAGLPALRGLQLVAQAAVMESQGPAFGFALSAGRLLGLGD